MTMLVYMVGRNIPLYGIDIDAYSNVNVDAQSYFYRLFQVI